MTSQKSYVPGLDSLRWLSAVAVIITHIELHKGYHGLENIWDSRWVQNLGPVGVYFFFTLSGFLITWLLQRDRGRPLLQVLPSFCRRRAGRILPLYFLMVLLGFFVLPQLSPFQYPGNPPVELISAEFVAFGLCQPHVASSFLPRVPNISHLWSIGVELTFYLVWPFLVLGARKLPRAILLFVAGMIALKAAILLLAPALPGDRQSLFHLAATLKLECMAIGGWFALPIHSRSRGFLASPGSTRVCVLAVPLVFLLYGTPLDNGVHILLSVLFGVIISNVVWGISSLPAVLDNCVFRYLGRISYGIYCYHVACITLVLNFLGAHATSLSGNVMLYGAVVSSCLLISALSFHYFERPLSRFLSARSSVIELPNAECDQRAENFRAGLHEKKAA